MRVPRVRRWFNNTSLISSFLLTLHLVCLSGFSPTNCAFYTLSTPQLLSLTFTIYLRLSLPVLRVFLIFLHTFILYCNFIGVLIFVYNYYNFKELLGQKIIYVMNPLWAFKCEDVVIEVISSLPLCRLLLSSKTSSMPYILII